MDLGEEAALVASVVFEEILILNDGGEELNCFMGDCSVGELLDLVIAASLCFCKIDFCLEIIDGVEDDEPISIALGD